MCHILTRTPNDTIMIRCALDSLDLGRHFRYAKHYLSMHRKFFRDYWSQKSVEIMAFWGLYKRFGPRMFLPKPSTSHSWYIKSPICSQNHSEVISTALCPNPISNTYKELQSFWENFFWDFFKKRFLSKIFIFVRFLEHSSLQKNKPKKGIF